MIKLPGVCEICKENKEVIDILSFDNKIITVNDNFQTHRYICTNCYNILMREKSITEKNGKWGFAI